MIWIGCFALLCSLATLYQAVVTLRLVRQRKTDAFEGPARLELFGHTTHIGWVRQGSERIDLLTIEGEALQCDARARYRLTPLRWKEFVGECLRRREEVIDRIGHEIRSLKEARAESEARRGALRCAISDALEALQAVPPRWSPAIAILDAAREKDGEHDAPPF